jgi:hypothetical protein
MKLSELNKFAAKHFGNDDPELMIQLEDDGCMGFTGIIRAGIYVAVGKERLINFLPASCLVHQSMEVTATRHLTGGVTSDEKSALCGRTQP